MGYGMLQDANGSPAADLLVANAKLVATCDGSRRELPGGWVAITGGLISGVGSSLDPAPAAVSVLDAAGCLVTPGLINTHHHIYQNLTRSYGPAINGTLFQWLAALYPLWARIDEEAAYLSAWVGLAELALGGCTTTTDHLYVAPRGGGDLWSAEITAAREAGMRFHPTRGSMTVGVKDGGLTPDSVVQEDDEVLAGKPGHEAALAEAGRLVGRVAHLLDAVEDLAADQASGTWNPLPATGAGVGAARRLCDDALLGIRLALAEAEFTDSRLVTALLVNELGRSVRRTFAHAGGAGASARPWLRRRRFGCCCDCCADGCCEGCCDSCGDCDCCGGCDC